MESVKKFLLKNFDWFFFFYHVIFFFFLCSTVANGRTVVDVYVFFVLSIILTFILLKFIIWFNLTEYKLQIFAGEIFFSCIFLISFNFNTYSVESFIGYIFAIVCCGFLFARKYLLWIPVISAVAAFILPEYLFSYFQVVNMALLLQCNKKSISKAEYKKLIVSSYLMQLIAMSLRILISSKEKIIGLNYFNGNIHAFFPLIFLLMACFIAYGYECLKKNEKYIRISYIISIFLVLVGSIFLRDIHVYVSALFLLGIEVFYLAENNNFREKINILKNCYWNVLLVTFIMKFYVCMDKDLISRDPFTICAYYFNYFDFGFTQRSLVGTLFYLLFGYYIPEKYCYVYVTSFFYLSYALLALILIMIYRAYIKSPKNDNSYVPKVLFFLYLTSAPFLLHAHERFVFRLDLYGMCLAFLSIYILYKNRYVFFVSILCVLGILNHQVFVFIVFPMIFIVFVYRVFIDCGNHFKRNLIAFSIMVLSVIGIFVYLQFFSHAYTAISGEEAIEIVLERSGGFVSDDNVVDGESSVLTTVIFADAKTHVEIWQNRIMDTHIIMTLKKFAYSLPLIVLYFYAFFKSAKYEEDKFKKFIYYAMPFSIIAFLPTYVLELDFGRWNQHLLATFMLVLFFLTILQSEDKKWYRDIDKKKMKIWLATVYILMIKMQLFTIFG